MKKIGINREHEKNRYRGMSSVYKRNTYVLQFLPDLTSRVSKSLISIELSIKIIQKQDRLTGKSLFLKKQLLASFSCWIWEII